MSTGTPEHGPLHLDAVREALHAVEPTVAGLVAEHRRTSRRWYPHEVVPWGRGQDFNATPWSAGMRRAMAGNLQYRSLSAPWRPTWEVGSIFGLPIDHVLCTAPLVIASRAIGPDVGSDHRPQQISVGMESHTR